MKKNHGWHYVVIALTILLLGTMLILSPFHNKKRNAEEASVENSTSTETASTETAVSATPVDNIDVSVSEDVNISNSNEPDYYEDLWLVDEEGRKYIWIGQEIGYKDEYDEAGIILTKEELLAGQTCSNDYGLEDGYLDTLYPITLHIAKVDNFIEDVPVWMSNELIVFPYEKFIPFLVEEGYDGDLYLLYYGTAEEYNGAIMDIRFYISTEEDDFQKWVDGDTTIIQGKKICWIHIGGNPMMQFKVIDPWEIDENGNYKYDSTKIPKNW